MDNNVQDALIFCGLVMGIKGVPFNTDTNPEAFVNQVKGVLN